MAAEVLTYERLLEIWRNREPVTIRTSAGDATSMAPTSLRVEHEGVVVIFRRITVKGR